MSDAFAKVKGYLLNVELPVIEEDAAEEIVVVQNADAGLNRLIIDCEAPIVILEHPIMSVPNDPNNLFKRLLQLNRTLVHGAFVLDDEGTQVLWRDTLQLASLDEVELESSVDALILALAENAAEFLRYAQARKD